MELIDWVVAEAGDVGSQRLREPVYGWFAEGLIDKQSITREDYEHDFALPAERRRQQLHERGHGYLRDAESEVGWWSSYHDAPHRQEDRPLPQRLAPAEGTFVRDGPKAGRNDPCPCGSGRKYKKCHGAS